MMLYLTDDKDLSRYEKCCIIVCYHVYVWNWSTGDLNFSYWRRGKYKLKHSKYRQNTVLLLIIRKVQKYNISVCTSLLEGRAKCRYLNLGGASLEKLNESLNSNRKAKIYRPKSKWRVTTKTKQKPKSQNEGGIM